MDALDAGQDIAWREGTRGPEVFIERDAEVERAHVTIKDASSSLTAVTVTVPLADAWFDDAYRLGGRPDDATSSDHTIPAFHR